MIACACQKVTDQKSIFRFFFFPPLFNIYVDIFLRAEIIGKAELLKLQQSTWREKMPT